MTQKKKSLRIECLERYGAYTSSLEDIMEFLFLENLLSKEEIKLVKQSASPAKELENFLSSLKTQSKLQLLEYEWMLLPVERIKIHIITDRLNKEFTFNC